MAAATASVKEQTAEKPGPRMRSRLLDAAAARFKQSGLASVSVAEIAADAGAFPSQVTYYFGSKEALFVEAACREMLYLARDAEAASAHPKNEDDYLETLVRSVIGAPGLNLFVEALALAHRRPDLKPLVQRTFERLDAESDRALREHRAQQGLPPGRTAVLAHRFWVIALGMGARGGATGESDAFLAAEMLALLSSGGKVREGSRGNAREPEMLKQKIATKRPAPAGFDLGLHMGELEADGFTIIEDYLSAAQLQRFRDGLAPSLGTYRGRNPFEGLTTERVYTLVGRGAVFEECASDPRLLAILDHLLAPNYLLSADHAICIYPGEKAQGLHWDDTFYPFPRPRPAISISTIGAIDTFTPQNGGTVMYRGSHKWPSARVQALREALARGQTTEDTQRVNYLTMPAGGLCVFQGTLIHGAGANRSDAPRLGYTNHYCEPWARPQENFYLGVPKEKVRGMSREMQILLGYELLTTGSIMGQVGGYNPAKTLDPDFVIPVLR